MQNQIVLCGTLLILLISSVYATPDCSINTDNLGLVLDTSQSYSIQLENVFNGFNLTYDVDTDQTSAQVTQTASIPGNVVHQSNFNTIVSYDYWRNTDGSTTHSLLERSGQNFRVYFGKSIYHNTAPQWVYPSNFALQGVTNCFSVVLLSNYTAAVDCIKQVQNSENFMDVLFLINQQQSSVNLQELDTWDQQRNYTQFTSRRTVKLNEQYKENPESTDRIVYLFSGAPYTAYIPLGSMTSSFVSVIQVTLSQFGPNESGMANPIDTFNEKQFKLTSFPLADLASTNSGAYFLLEDTLIAFTYSNDELKFQTSTFEERGVRLAALQLGYSVVFSVITPTLVRELKWDFVGEISVVSSFQSEISLNQAVQALMSPAYVLVNLQNRAVVFRRAQTTYQNTPFFIDFSNYAFTQTALLLNDYMYFISDSNSLCYSLQPPTVEIVTPGPEQLSFNIRAYSIDNTEALVCQVLVTVTRAQTDLTQIIPANTVIPDFFQYSDQLSFTIPRVYIGSDLSYSVKQGSTVSQQQLGASELSLNITVFQNGPTNATNLGKDVPSIFSYSYSSPLDINTIYLFNQLSGTFELQVSTCQITDGAPNNLYCTQLGSLPLKQQIQNMAAGNYFSTLIYTLCLVGDNETSINIYDLLSVTKQVVKRITFDTVATTDVSDVDIIGGYLYITLPLLEQVQVYDLKIVSQDVFLPLLYVLDTNFVKSWPHFNSDPAAWSPLAVHAHLDLPNYIYIEMLDSIVTVSVSYKDPVYVSYFSLDSKENNPRWDRALLITPNNFIILESYTEDGGATATKSTFTEYITTNPYNPIKTKSFQFSAVPLSFPLVYRQSIQGTYLYVLSQDSKKVLIFQAGAQQQEFVKHIIQLGSSAGQNINLAVSTKDGQDYAFVANGGDQSSILSYFVPQSAYFTLSSSIVPTSTKYIVKDVITITTSSSFSSDTPSIQTPIQVVNTQNAVINTDTNSFKYNFNSQRGAVQMCEIDDSSWFYGAYESLDMDGDTTCTLINHVDLATNLKLNISTAVDMFYSVQNEYYIAVLPDNKLQTYDRDYNPIGSPIKLALNDSTYNCYKTLPFDGFTFSYTLVFCEDTKEGTNYVDVINNTDTANSQKIFLLLDGIEQRVTEAQVFLSKLYVLNNSPNPERDENGLIIVYDLINNINAKSDMISVHTFDPLTIVSDEFVITSFFVNGVNENGDAENESLFLLDRYGQGVVAIYFNSSFSSEGQNPIKRIATLDIADIINSQGGLILANTEFLRVLPLSYTTAPQLNNFTHQFLLVTTNTPIYDIQVYFGADGAVTGTNLNTVYNIYGQGTLRHTSLASVIKNTLIVRAVSSDPSYKYEHLTAYKLSSATDQKANLTRMMGSYKRISQTVFAGFIAGNFDYNVGQFTFFVGSSNNAVTTFQYNQKLTVVFSDISFDKKELVFEPNSLSIDKLVSAHPSVNVQLENLEPGPIPVPSSGSSSGGSTGSSANPSDDQKEYLLWIYIGSGIIGGLIVLGFIVFFLQRKTLQEDHENEDDEDQNFESQLTS